MPYQTLQLSDARADLNIKGVAGACANSADFVSLINTATRRLLKRGNWYETLWVLRVCFSGCEIAWPSVVGTVLGIRPCGKNDQVPIHNKWWTVVGPRSCNDIWNNSYGMIDGNTSPVHNQVSGSEGKLIRYYPVKGADIGKTLTLYGTKFGGQPLQELVGGEWKMGLTLTLATPFATTTELVTKITSVVREATVGETYLFEYDAATDTLRDLANYHPGAIDTNPRYRTSKLQNICAIPYCEDENGQKIRKVDALVKLNYVPVVEDRDFLVIDDLDSLALAIQAITLEQANAHADAEIKWQQAIRELNYADRDKNPDIQTAITCNVWGEGSHTLLNAY